MKKAIIFDIENRQAEYAQCLSFMELMEKRKILSKDSELRKIVNVITYDEIWAVEDIMEHNPEPLPENLTEVKVDNPIMYFFNVKCTAEDDIINLLYYCILHDRIAKAGHDSVLCVACSEKQGANISDFFTWILSTGTVNNCYIHTGKKYHQINADRIRKLKHEQGSGISKSRDGVRIVKQFSPIFRIDKDADEGSVESVMFWRQPMRAFLEKLYKKIADRQEKLPVEKDNKDKITFGENYFLPRVCPTDLHHKHPGEIWKGISSAKEQHLLNVLVECFCTVSDDDLKNDESVLGNFVEERYKYWKGGELFNKIKEIPVLAMYIFCLSDYFLRDIENDSWDRIDQEIFNARDMAEGLLQILENIHHSEMGKGYFCLRVHTDIEGRSKKYLRKEYSAYMKEWEEQESSPVPHDYLEIRVVDFSRCSIPVQFYSDFKKRMANASGKEKLIYEEIEKQAKNLKVSSFFGDSIDFWDKYNEITENVVHHYGLQIFESLVSCYDGYFRVRSQSKEKLQRTKELYVTHKTTRFLEKAIPGTQYDILIPFRKQVQMQNLSLNININYTEGLLKGYNDNVCRDIELVEESCTNILREIKNEYPGISYQETKEMAVRGLSDKLKYLMDEKVTDKHIMHFSAKKIPLTRIELFCKAVMFIIAQKPEKQSFYAMITDCTTAHFVEITRMMTLFYNKQGVNSRMKNVQIFMSGKNDGEEFLITGANLGEAVGSTEKLAFARCTHPDCLRVMKKMLKNRNMGADPNEIVSIVPFDMIQYDVNQPTLLERRMIEVLNKDVQSDQFGCKLEGLHVRIGSKIHIRTFYESELLFHNNYYTSRFAYWLYNELCNNNELDLDMPFVLVGCENYSEMLLNELCNMFEKEGRETEYLIYEERIAGKFRGKRSLENYKNYQFIIIVPINSTLTTHIKVSGFLEKAIHKELKRNRMSTSPKYRLGKVLNYGIVLIDSPEENDYWNNVGDEKNTIISKIDDSKMKFYIKVSSQWENPLKCTACFPDKDYTNEIPLVETNKESIVPMHAIGIRKSDYVNKGAIGEDDEQIQDLAKFLVYKHVERNGNHFNYYFATERLWDFPEIREKIRKWLGEKKEELRELDGCKVYDIIVAPLHYSNTVFVEEVNEHLFKNAALVLHFDADREFRMNVRTKYSSIQQLYDNLCEDNEKSIINYHYVDDTIVSGRTFRRMKSLIASLIHKNGKSVVQINIFKSVVLLLNRMSASSIRDYIGEKQHFFAYFNLQISSMRVNSDACILCKKYQEWNKLAQQASLNKVFSYWYKRSGDLKCDPVEKINIGKDTENDKILRNEQYMLASHRAKSLLDAACDYMNRKELQQLIVDNLFPDNVDNSPDKLIAVLKVLGRPFLSFRKEEREAVFKLMLVMLETLLKDECPAGEEKLDILLMQIWQNKGYRIKIVKILMNRLTELESNYIIRKRSMENILSFWSKHIADKGEKQDFIDNYLNRVKQLVGQSNDFAKGLFLEYLLLYDEEYPKTGKGLKSSIVSLTKGDEKIHFKQNAYLENTKLVNYGIEYLAESFQSHQGILTEDALKTTLNENYYFDNFIQYLAFHKVVETDGRGKVQKFVSDREWKKIDGMVRFELLYQGIFGELDLIKHKEEIVQREVIAEKNIKDKYTEMLECLRDASGATDGEIIVPYETEEMGKKYIALELGTSRELRRLESSEREIKEFMDQNIEFEGDTYAICNGVEPWSGLQKWLLLKFFEKTDSNNNDDISEIYLLFAFRTQDEDEIVHALKNILMFRHKIWKILNLSSSTLLKNWTDNLFYKQQMLKSRAVHHSELEDLMGQFKDFIEKIYQEQTVREQQNEESWHMELCRDHFEILVNSMIGAMNVRVLGNKGRDYTDTIEHTFMQYWKAVEHISQVAALMWKLDINIKGAEFEEHWIRFGTNQKDQQRISPQFLILDILFLAVLHDIRKHGVQDENQRRKVFISIEEEKVCISNRISEAERSEIEEMISPKAYRSGQGISKAVIYDICKSWYDDTRYSDMFVVCPDTENQETKKDRNEWLYVVKLPIIERRDENE